jgi:hypothetical protein
MLTFFNLNEFLNFRDSIFILRYKILYLQPQNFSKI